MQIRYGTHTTNIDITDLVKKSARSGILYIPPNDERRSKLYTDPIYGKRKHIFLHVKNVIREYDADTPVFIDTVEDQVYTVPPFYIIELYPDECVEIKLAALHRTLTLRHGSFRDEGPEQRMAVRFLKGTEKVLEIGGNIGRNSLILASLLPPNSLVTLESDPAIAKQLEENRDINNMSFAIEASALSLRPLIQRGWDTMVSEELLEGYKWVKTITLPELRAKYEFDTLVLDCEGAFYYILSDMPEILDGITKVLMENDYYNVEHKQFIDAKLKERGFQCIYTEALGPEYAYKKFPFEKNFFETWIK
jgi:FkbM family methyltransferase